MAAGAAQACFSSAQSLNWRDQLLEPSLVPEPGLDAEVRSTETREHATGMRSNPDELSLRGF